MRLNISNSVLKINVSGLLPVLNLLFWLPFIFKMMTHKIITGEIVVKYRKQARSTSSLTGIVGRVLTTYQDQNYLKGYNQKRKIWQKPHTENLSKSTRIIDLINNLIKNNKIIWHKSVSYQIQHSPKLSASFPAFYAKAKKHTTTTLVDQQHKKSFRYLLAISLTKTNSYVAMGKTLLKTIALEIQTI